MAKNANDLWRQNENPFFRCIWEMSNANEEPTLIDFGRFIRDCRKANGLTQEELAERAGLHVNLVGRIERGASDARISTVLRLAAILCDKCAKAKNAIHDEH